MSHHITRKLHSAATKVTRFVADIHDMQLRKRLSFIAQQSAHLREELKAHDDSLVLQHAVAKGECAQRIEQASRDLSTTLRNAYAQHDDALDAAHATLATALTQATSGHALITDQIKTELEAATAEAEAHRNEVLSLIAS